MIAENSRSVLSNMLDDIKKAWFVTLIVVQTIFIVFYTYSIYSNVDNLIFLITYSILCLLSLISFVVFLVKHKNHKKQNKRFLRIRNFIRYILNAIMLVVVIVEMVQFGISDFSKILLVVSAVSLLVQIVIECIKMFAEKYVRDFHLAIEQDFAILDPTRFRSNILKMINIPLDKIVLMKEGKEKELSEDEKRLEEHRNRFTARMQEQEEWKSVERMEKRIEKKKQEELRIGKEWKKIKEKVICLVGKKKKDETEEKSSESKSINE